MMASGTFKGTGLFFWGKQVTTTRKRQGEVKATQAKKTVEVGRQSTVYCMIWRVLWIGRYIALHRNGLTDR